MSGSWRQPGQDWIYMLANISDFPPPRRPLYPRGRNRGPWLLVEDRSNYGLPSFPPAQAPRPWAPTLYLEDTYSAPSYHQPWNERGSTRDESKLSQEEQKEAVNKLRKQLYSPHISGIIRRLGTKSSTPGDDDDAGKRCAVCLEDFETKQFVTTTPCNHMFHEECIVPWVKSQGKCPVCRFLIAQKRNDDVAPSHARVRRNVIF